MKTHATYLGIDISKTTLHLGTSEKFVKEFSNTATGHRQLIERSLKLETPRVVLEASGGHERRVCEALQDADGRTPGATASGSAGHSSDINATN